MNRLRLLGALTLSLAPCVVAACSDSATPAPAGDGDAAADANALPDVVPASNEAVMSGRVITAQRLTFIEGAELKVGAASATTNGEGRYAIAVPKTSPFRARITAADHYALLEQEYSIGGKATLDRGDTQLLSTTTANLLVAFLDGYDKTKGIVAVRVTPLAPCASEEGATVTLDPPAGSQFRYVENSIPRQGTTAVKKDESISIIFYNVDLGVKVRPVVTHPTCEVLPFPVVVGDVTYTSDVQQAEPGESLAYVRIFVGPPKASDAGAD